MNDALDCRLPDIAEVELWRVLGIPGWLFPTKLSAEAAARFYFPDEDPDRRYGRLSYVTYHREER